ncbi:MAG: TonB-dependent siderophore receptor, partial [Cyanobacteria bacterium P01_G01_bin.49]
MKSYYRFQLNNSRIVWILTVLTILCTLPNRAIAEVVEVQENPPYSPLAKGGETSPPKGTAADLIAQGVTRVTGVEVIQTGEGLELILKTVAGSERLVPLILPQGNDLVIDILDATLAFSIRRGIEELNPAPGINRIAVNKVDDTSIRVTITGENQTPSAEVVPGRDDLVLSVTPEDTTVEEPVEEIEVIATGQAEDEDAYYVPDARNTLKTNVDIRDTPSSVQVIPQQLIEDQGATNVRDIVRNAAAVNLSQDGSGRFERFTLRGFAAEQFRNGFRDNVRASLTEAELANIERVEVLKGPASVLFGQAEPSGIINFVTKKPLREPFYEVEFTAGSFDFYRPTLDFSGPLTENGNLAYRLNVAYENAGSFRDGVESERFFVAPTLSWEIGDDTELTLEFSYLDDTRPIDRGLVVLSDDEVADIPFDTVLGDPDKRVDFEETRTEIYLDHRFNGNLSLNSRLRYNTASEAGPRIEIGGESEDDRNFPVGESMPFIESETFAVQNDLIAKFNTGEIEHTLLFGFEYTNEFAENSSEAREGATIDIFNPSRDFTFPGEFEPRFDVEVKADSFGIYLQNQIAILDNLQLVIGGRFDTADTEIEDVPTNEIIAESGGDAFSPRVGIVYRPVEPVSLYASYTRS